MAKILVSFATRPGKGSEGGVGWAFVSQAALWAVNNAEDLYVVIDQRDHDVVLRALAGLGNVGTNVKVVPVSVPRMLLKTFGDSRNRATYLGWSVGARACVANLVDSGTVDVVHQVTFASTSLPHVLPSGDKSVRTIWGPVMVPSAPVHSQGKRPRPIEVVGVWGLRKLGKFHARNVDLVIATNEFTRNWLMPRECDLEPNIVIDVDQFPRIAVENDLLTMSGLLINRKRPWIALEALLDPRLANYRLNIVGDGPLRPVLEGFAKRSGLVPRVNFLGVVDREEALRLVAASRVLLHPAAREGASWAVGEAAALGVPAVAVQGSGADSTIRLSQNGGFVVRSDQRNLVNAFAEAILTVLSRPRPLPSTRWSAARFPALFDKWWLQDDRKVEDD
ncbi:glycosyltransferase [Cryobacterium sp. TMT2-18-3]|uniref:glycosyltransferase n=1 Tax=unclassified Cryobacterium TaxID=2649013 RepID=UPI00106A6C84|nr:MULTISPECIES: glycosyltransferase [unclassified Cryobacterium]TFC32015.1 glycosyltransferase [Cryobacterium sp. TMT2-18-2]TFC62927.1 glycosyltransferase [Cryobacterium sp. TMT2-18-3]